MAANLQLFAEVIVDIAARQLGDKLFTYCVPEWLSGEVFIGTQVLVPFGTQQMVAGYVVGLGEEKPSNLQAKAILAVLDSQPLYDRTYIDFLWWIADYYGATLSQTIAACVPQDFGTRLRRTVKLNEGNSDHKTNPCPEMTAAPAPRAQSAILTLLEKSKTKSMSLGQLRKKLNLPASEFYKALSNLRKQNRLLVQTEASHKAQTKYVSFAYLTGNPPESKRQEEIVSILSSQGGKMSVKALAERAGTTHATIKKMAKQGIIVLGQEEEIRDPLAAHSYYQNLESQKPALTTCQENVLSVLLPELMRTLAAGEAKPLSPWLLHGVTGSGKTEIYLRLIEETLAHKRTALLLVPEISLTPQLAQRLKGRFGQKVAVWHSGLSSGERFDTWKRLRQGAAQVLVGARSAVLVNMPDLGLIILDEEHDSSYKQTSPSPRYHAKRLAEEKAKRSGALVVLGSATPDITSYRQALGEGRLLQLPERVFQQKMPEVKIVDMRKEFADGHRELFSRPLSFALANCLQNQKQAILLINRRGFASHVFCQACGFIFRCRNCSVSLVFHQRHTPTKVPASREEGFLSCHHCGLNVKSTSLCPSCQSPYLKHFGLGTQKVEQECREKFANARIVRLDSDVTAKRGAYETILQSFSQGQADILIGTQMIAKGLDIPNVTVVGVLAADAAFNLPDYRAVERGFQLLTQVAGRAGRGLAEGSVFLQTYSPDLPALSLAARHDYEGFYQEELQSRLDLDYPPACQLMRIVVTGQEEAPVIEACDRLAEELAQFLDDHPQSQIQLLGPAPCLIDRLKGKFRHQLIIKNLGGEAGRKLVVDFVRGKKLGKNLTMAIDVDPYDFM